MQGFVGKEIDRYRIIAQQGMGGMAVVYKAYDTRLDRDVALKVIRTDMIPPEQHERLLKRFEREAKAQAQFSHPNIVPVYDYGEVDGLPYLVMEFIPGGTLKGRIKNPIHYHQALKWLTPIADALAYAHQQGVVHRDVKPSNILFDKTGRPILTDFGIAKVLETSESTLTATGMGVGTPEYMAPEQWKGEDTETSDQYALGAVLYEALTGHKPFTAETPVAVALKQITESLHRPSEWVPDIPESVEKTLYKALALNPENRFDDMNAFHRVLEELSTSLDVSSDQETVFRSDKKDYSPRAPLPVNSESETVDVFDPGLSSGAYKRKTTASQTRGANQKKSFPKWLIWVGLGLAVICLVGGGITLAVLGSDLFGSDKLSVAEVAGTRDAQTVEEQQNENLVDNDLTEEIESSVLLPTSTIGVPSATLALLPTETFTLTPQPERSKTPTRTPSGYITPTPKAYTPLANCAASQLHLGDSAFISYEGGTNYIRKDPDVSKDDNMLDKLQPGEVMIIIGGPRCSYGWILWEVQTTWGETGWSAESDGEEFWILPLTTRQACDGALPTRLVVGDRAKVMEEPPQANLLRTGPGRFDTTIDRIQPGHWMLVLEGPVCGEGTNWWRVQSEDTGKIGWTMEGDLNVYWLAPEP